MHSEVRCDRHSPMANPPPCEACKSLTREYAALGIKLGRTDNTKGTTVNDPESQVNGYLAGMNAGREAADARSVAQVVDVIGERVKRLPDSGVDGLPNLFAPGLGIDGVSSNLRQGLAEFSVNQLDGVAADAHDETPSVGAPTVAEDKR